MKMPHESTRGSSTLPSSCTWQKERASLLLIVAAQRTKLQRAETKIAQLELGTPEHRHATANMNGGLCSATSSRSPRRRGLLAASLVGASAVAVVLQWFVFTSVEGSSTCADGTGGCAGQGAGAASEGSADDDGDLFHKVGRIFNEEERKARKEKHDDADAVGKGAHSAYRVL